MKLPAFEIKTTVSGDFINRKKQKDNKYKAL
jgi:hypothetical protein